MRRSPSPRPAAPPGADKARGAVDTSGTELPLPHERDQASQNTGPHPDPAIRQAGKDLADGQVDTDMRATPGLDAQRREGLVPGTAGRVKRR